MFINLLVQIPQPNILVQGTQTIMYLNLGNKIIPININRFHNHLLHPFYQIRLIFFLHLHTQCGKMSLHHTFFQILKCIHHILYINSLHSSVTELGSITDRRPGPARQKRDLDESANLTDGARVRHRQTTGPGQEKTGFG